MEGSRRMFNSLRIEDFKKSLPLIEKNREGIVNNFYEKLFQQFPSLIGSKIDLSDEQKRVVAEAMLNMLQNIELIQFFLKTERGFEKVSGYLPIQSEEFPLVGECLVQAIREELGSEATSNTIAAWKHVVEVVIEALIESQPNDSEKTKVTANGEDFKSLVIDKRTIESDGVISLYLKPRQGETLPPFKPGQHVRVKVTLPGQKETHIRYFSLSDSPEKDYYRLTVKKGNPNSKEELTPTNYMYEGLKVGDEVIISQPAGSFILKQDSNDPVILLSGGVGITPMLSMLNAILATQPDRPVTFIHATANSKTHSFRSYLNKVAEKNGHVNVITLYDSPTEDDRSHQRFDMEGFLTSDYLQSILKNNEGDFYFCGPTPFMKLVYTILKEWGVPKKHIHYEYFGPGDLETL